jgi:hypothetical protein
MDDLYSNIRVVFVFGIFGIYFVYKDVYIGLFRLYQSEALADLPVEIEIITL